MKKLLLYSIPIGLVFIFCISLWNNKLNYQQATVIFSQQIASQPTPTPKAERITIAAVGDIGLSRETNYQIIVKNNPNFPFEKISNFISSVDTAIGNLEGPVIDNCPTVRTGFKFCGRPENIQGLNFAGFDALNLANNHINDYGTEGLSQTIRALQDYQLGYFFDDKVWYKEVKQTKFGFLGFDDTVNKIENSNIKTQIKKAKKNADIVVVNFHWGVEYQTEPTERQRELAKLAVDSGADVIIGHHPHVIQPLEYYQGKPVFYSLGNFVFDQMWSEATKKGVIGLITIKDKKIVQTGIKKIYISTCCQPELLK